jgi:hypothetical protein
LPEADEDMAPAFSHTPATAIPSVELGGAVLRVLIGAAFGAVSPVLTRSPTVYLDIALAAGAQLDLPGSLGRERALYAVEGGCALDGEAVAALTMAVLPEVSTVRVSATQPVRLVLIGGEPLGQRFIWWNFVASRKEAITQAADAWAAQPNERFAQVPGETEFIALPERRP